MAREANAEGTPHLPTCRLRQITWCLCMRSPIASRHTVGCDCGWISTNGLLRMIELVT
jgi:hypothetical protein